MIRGSDGQRGRLSLCNVPSRRRTRSAAVLAALLVALAACGASPAGTSAPTPDSAHISTVHAGSQLDALTYSHGSLWVGDYGGSEVIRIDPASGKVLARITTGAAPIWIQGDKRWIWVANYFAATVSRIDPNTNRVDRTVRVGNQPEGLAVAAGQVWVSNQLDGTVSRIDQRTGRPAGVLHVGGAPVYIAADATDLWLTNTDENGGSLHKVQRIDASTGKLTAERSLGAEPFHALPAFGSTWVSDYADDVVYRLDPDTLHTTARIPVGHAPDALYADGTSLWVSDDHGARVQRIDPATNQVTAVIRLDGAPRNMAVAGDALWIAGFDKGVVYRVPLS